MATSTHQFVTPVQLRAVVHPGTPDTVRDAIWHFVDEVFRDVHALLQMPMPLAGETPFFHFTIAASLLSVISGLSRLLYDPHNVLGDHRCFVEAFQAAYPWDSEYISQEINANEAAEILYGEFRNPFVHALGMSHRGGPKRVLRLVRMAPWRIEELEILAQENFVRPHGWPPAIHPHLNRIDIYLDPLYSGVRRMVYNLTSDRERMAEADEMLTKLRRHPDTMDIVDDPRQHEHPELRRSPNPLMLWCYSPEVWPYKDRADGDHGWPDQDDA